MPELFENTSFPVLLLTGTMILIAIVFSQIARRIRLPGVVAYMITGILLGPITTRLALRKANEATADQETG